jgi:hypothetical protein
VKIVFTGLFVLLLTLPSYASFGCAKECKDISDNCLQLGKQSKSAVRTMVELSNLFRAASALPQVPYVECPRTNDINHLSFRSAGSKCIEWSVATDHEPGASDDHLKGNYTSVSLPKVIRGVYNPNDRTLRFDPATELPFFAFRTNGKTWTSGEVTSVTDIKMENDNRLVLETDNICYSVDL